MTATDHPERMAAAGILPDIVYFIAVMASVLTLGMALAHLFALPNKMVMSREDYFVAQAAYLGWFQIWVVLLIQLIALIALAVLYRSQPAMFWPAVIALVCFIAAQALFWAYTFPANQATQNWTTIPDNWEELRRNWEYSHAAAALIGLLGMTSLVVGGISRMQS